MASAQNLLKRLNQKRLERIPEEEEEHEKAPSKKQKAGSSSSSTFSSSSSIIPNKSEQNEDESSSSEVTFSSLGVNEHLCKTIESLNWKSPSKIQRETLPYSLAGRDVIGLAETGSGKTGAFAIPVLQRLIEMGAPARGVFCVVICPTRELAFQIGTQFSGLGSGIGVRATVLVGGVDTMSQAISLAKKPHIVVATPGRLIWHLENTKGFTINTLKYLVLDEADRLFSLDFEDELNAILAVAPASRNTFLFSATMTDKVEKLQRVSLRDPVRVQVSQKYQTVATLLQNYLFIPAKFKDCYLAFLMTEFSGCSTIIFVSTCHTSLRVTLFLRNLGFTAIPINGRMTQGKRLNALNKFKEGDRSILVATDVAARGLDIPLVDLVLNFELPVSPKDYVHRVGRTARAGASGRSIAFVTQYDVENFTRIESFINQKLEVFPAEEDRVLVYLERVNEAQRFAALQLKELEEKDGTRSRRNNDDDDDSELALTNKSKIKRRNVKNNNNKNQSRPTNSKRK